MFNYPRYPEIRQVEVVELASDLEADRGKSHRN